MFFIQQAFLHVRMKTNRTFFLFLFEFTFISYLIIFVSYNSDEFNSFKSAFVANGI